MRDVRTMQEVPDLGIPEVKPAIESIRGRWERKVSPRRRHGLLQGRLWHVLTEWAGDRGDVASEWRFYFLAQDEKPSSLVPDVAYVSFDRMPPELGERREQPTIAPDIAVEIVSPDDRRALLDEKIALYRANGCLLVIVVDSQSNSVEMHDADGVRGYSCGDVAITATYTDLRIALDPLFAGL